jgi:hypothetical protein
MSALDCVLAILGVCLKTLAYRQISELKDKLAPRRSCMYLEEEIRGDFNFENIVGNSPAATSTATIA